MLKTQIIDIVKNNQTDRQKDLFRMVKSVLTELTNMGYSQKYIYEVMNRYFWNPQCTIDSNDQIDNFFDAFSTEDNDYEVVFSVQKRKIDKFISYVDNLELVDDWQLKFGSNPEKKFFKTKKDYTILKFSTKALDPFAAAQHAKDLISINSSIYRLFDHNFKYDINRVNCGVYTSERFYTCKQNISAVEHTKSMSTKQIENSMQIADNAISSIAQNKFYDEFFSIISAARLHLHSLNSNSEENQLLDLWAIFESVLDISNKHTSDRINQVCMHLVPILKIKYIYSLFSQLASDIKYYDVDTYNNIVGTTADRDEQYRKICEFTILDSRQKERDEFLKKCSDFPLLKERIEYYASELNSTAQVYKFVEKHGERVKWQVMRIYRNRNLIIHNARSMPYLSLLIENLHSYVDDFLSYSIIALSEGHNIESMCQELFVKECQWNAEFQRGSRQMNEDLIKKMLAI